MKLVERIINHVQIPIVEMGNIHFVFRIGRSSMDPVFVLQFLQETYKEKQHAVYMVSADRLSFQRFDMEYHVNDIDSRVVHQCAETFPNYELDVTELYNSSYDVVYYPTNSFTVWDISFILQKLLHSSMVPFPLNNGVGSLNLHEYGMADVSTASIVLSSVFIHQYESGLITCLIHLHLTQLLPDLLYTDIGCSSPSVFRAYNRCSFV